MSSFLSSIFGSRSTSRTPPPPSSVATAAVVPPQSPRKQQPLQSATSPKCTPQKTVSSSVTAAPKSNRNNNNNINTNNTVTSSRGVSKAPPSPRPPTAALSTTNNFLNHRSSSCVTSSTSMMTMNPSHAPPTRDNIKVTVRVRPPPNTTTSSLSSSSFDTNSITSSSDNYFSYPSFSHQQQQSALICDELAHQLFVNGRHEPFSFDQVLSETTGQQDTYNVVAKPLLDDALKGYNSCLFAYGQTGAGKSYSMLGNSQKVEKAFTQQQVENNNENEKNDDDKDNKDDDADDLLVKAEHDFFPNLGIVPRLCKDLFVRLNEMKKAQNNNSSSSWIVSIGFVEIYNEQVFDLLDSSYTNAASNFSNVITSSSSQQQTPFFSNNNNNTIFQNNVPLSSQTQSQPQALIMNLTSQQSALLTQMNSKSLEVREDTTTNRFFVENQKFIQVHSVEQVSRYIERGLNARRVAETCMNERSSRSHALFQIIMEETTAHQNTNSNNNLHLKMSKINLVDLAGSENAKKTEAAGQQRVEGGHINKSLLALRQVIDERAQGKPFVSYRNSVLTKLLKDSLGGNSKTAMLACVSPQFTNLDETLNTLRYASKACNIVNTVRVNEKHLISPPPSHQMQNQMTSLSSQIMDLEQLLESEKQNAEGYQSKIFSFESRCCTLEQNLQDQKKLFAIQEEEIAEMKKQLEETRMREQQAIENSFECIKHFKLCEDSVNSQIENQKQDFILQKKKWENTKNSLIKKFEKEISQLQKDLIQTREEHSEIVEQLRQDSCKETQLLTEQLKLAQEQAQKREAELLEKIAMLEAKHQQEIETLKNSFLEKESSLNEDAADEVQQMKQEIANLAEENERQKKFSLEVANQDKKTISNLGKLVVQLEGRLGALLQEKTKENGFLHQRIQVLTSTIERLEEKLIEVENNRLQNHHSTNRRQREEDGNGNDNEENATQQQTRNNEDSDEKENNLF